MNKVINNSNITTPWPDNFFNASVLSNNNFTVTDSVPSSLYYNTFKPIINDVFTYVYSGLTESNAVDVARNKR